MKSRPSRNQIDFEAAMTAATSAANAAATAAQAASMAADIVRVAAATHSETLQLDLKYIKADLDEIKAKLENKYVTVEAFGPVRNLAYGFAGLLLTGIIVGLLALLIQKG